MYNTLQCVFSTSLFGCYWLNLSIGHYCGGKIKKMTSHTYHVDPRIKQLGIENLEKKCMCVYFPLNS